VQVRPGQQDGQDQQPDTGRLYRRAGGHHPPADDETAGKLTKLQTFATGGRASGAVNGR
jgi:hypothetical protein